MEGSADGNIVYTRPFCEGYDTQEGRNITTPCIDLTLNNQAFTFLINPGKDYTHAEQEVIDQLNNSPSEVTIKSLEGYEKTAQQYPARTARLGRQRSLKSGYPIVADGVARYKETFDILAVLGARDMRGLIWDLDYENHQVRVYDSFSEETAEFRVQCEIFFTAGTGRAPYVLCHRLPEKRASLELDLMEAEDITLPPNQISTLVSGHAITPDSTRASTLVRGEEGLSATLDARGNLAARVDLTGIKLGQSYRYMEGNRDVVLETLPNIEPYLFTDMLKIYDGHRSRLGIGFFAKQHRVIIDLKNNRLLIKPNPAYQQSLSGCWSRSGI